MARLKPKLPFPVVQVDWIDSTGGNGWQHIDDYTEGSLEAVSIGFLIDQTDKSVTIASSYHAGCKQVHSPMTIPRVAITKITKLKV